MAKDQFKSIKQLLKIFVLTLMTKITEKEKNRIMKALASGNTPQLGLHHLMVGRKRETEALCEDLNIIKNGGATFRTVVGPFGSGKTFLINMSALLALKQDFVVLRADLSVNRRRSEERR